MPLLHRVLLTLLLLLPKRHRRLQTLPVHRPLRLLRMLLRLRTLQTLLFLPLLLLRLRAKLFVNGFVKLFANILFEDREEDV